MIDLAMFRLGRDVIGIIYPTKEAEFHREIEEAEVLR